jgi:hypothetical protein
MWVLFVVAITLYVTGYTSWGSDHTDGVAPKFLKTLIRPPAFIFWICARPKLKKYPAGVMWSSGLLNQLLGLGVLILGVVFHANPNFLAELGRGKVLIELACLALIAVFSVITVHRFTKKYPYIVLNRRHSSPPGK